jgi:hypothetical protein
MYVSTPPATAARAHDGRTPVGLGLAGVEYRTFTDVSPYTELDIVYFTDLMASYGLECSPEAFAAGRNTFTGMTDALMRQVDLGSDPLDLVILAHTTPDSEIGWPLCYLSDAGPPVRLSFAVSEQGVVAPFTALRLLGTYAATDDMRRALILVIDQAAQAHRRVPAGASPLRDCVAALLLTGGPAASTLSVADLAFVPADQVGARFASELAATTAGHPATVLVGAGLAPYWDGAAAPHEVLRTGPGQPCTGLWVLLAEHLPRWHTGRRVILADYDAPMGYLGVCTVDVPGGAS